MRTPRNVSVARPVSGLVLLLAPSMLSAQTPPPGSVQARLQRLYYAGELKEGMAVADSALAAVSKDGPGAGQDAILLRLLVARGRLAATDAFVGNRPLDDALAALRRAAALSEARPASPERADALVELGFAEYVQAFLNGGDFAPIRERFDRALEIGRQLDDPERIARALFHRGLIHERLGQLDSARSSYLETIAVADACGCLLVQSYGQRHLGFLLQGAGNPGAALHHLRRSLELREEVGFTVYLPYSLSAMADVLLQLGDPAPAAPYAERAMRVASDMAAPRTQAVVGLSLAHVRLALGDTADACRRFDRMRRLSMDIGYRAGEGAAREGLERCR